MKERGETKLNTNEIQHVASLQIDQMVASISYSLQTIISVISG